MKMRTLGIDTNLRTYMNYYSSRSNLMITKEGNTLLDLGSKMHVWMFIRPSQFKN
jgi:hypothetical protein